MVAICNSLPYHVYRLFQKYKYVQEMMITLTTIDDKEKISNDEFHKGKCLLARIDDLHTEEFSRSINTFDTDLSRAAKDSNSQYWDSSSMYEVKNYINYSSKEKANMFYYLHFNLSNSNQEKFSLKDELKSLKENPFATENSLSLMRKEISSLSPTKNLFFVKKKNLMNVPITYNLS